MGLHPEVKGFLRTKFPSAVSTTMPQADVVALDAMFFLFRMNTDLGGLGAVESLVHRVLHHARGGGKAYVIAFDIPELVPSAKAFEQKRRDSSRRKNALPEITSTAVCDIALPDPWHGAAVLNRKLRKQVVDYLAGRIVSLLMSPNSATESERRPVVETDELLYDAATTAALQATQLRKDIGHLPDGFRVIVHCGNMPDCGIYLASGGCFSRTEPPAAAFAAGLGEGDISCAFWLRYFAINEGLSGCAHGIDSDAVAINLLQLDADTSSRYVLLEAKTGAESCVVNLRALASEVQTQFGCSLDIFVFSLIIQKSDFIDKVVLRGAVGATIEAFCRTSSTRKLMSPEDVDDTVDVLNAARTRLPKKTLLRDNHYSAMTRAVWNFRYWAQAARGGLSPELDPAYVDQEGRSLNGWHADGSLATIDTLRRGVKRQRTILESVAADNV